MTLKYSVDFTVEWYARQRGFKIHKILNALNGVTHQGWHKGKRIPYEATTVLTLDEVERLNSYRKRK